MAPVPLLDVILAVGSGALALAALAGLIVRRKVWACVCFPVYLAAVAVSHMLYTVWPEIFWTWEFWAAADVVQTGLRLGVAFELGLRAFGGLPGGPRKVRVAFSLVTLGILAAVVAYPRQYNDAFELALIMGWVSYGVAVMFVAFLLLAMYYAVVPVDPLHRAIAVGFAVASAFLAFAHVLTIDSPWGRGFVSKTVYPLVLAWWAVAAWRHDSLDGLSAEALRRLWPWRTR